MKKYPVVVVKWRDAWHNEAQVEYEDLDSTCREEVCLWTTGFLVRNTKKEVVLANEVTDDRLTYRRITHIPKSLVKKISR